MFISETKFNAHTYPLNIKGFLSIRKDSNNPNYSGGLITYLRKEINYNRVNLLNISELIEYIAVKIKLSETEIVIVQVY